MANALSNIRRRNVGFSGPEGDLLNEQASQSVGRSPLITNNSLMAMMQPENYIQSGSNVIDLGQSVQPVNFGGNQAYRDRQGNVTAYTPSGEPVTMSAQDIAAFQAQGQKERELRKLQEQAMMHELQVKAGLVPKEAEKPQFNADAGGYIYPPDAQNPQGRFVPVSGFTKPDKPLTEYQGQSVMFGTRAAAAHNQMKGLEDKISTSGLKFKQGAESVPLLGGLISSAANIALSPEQQQVDQAQRNFVNALMRRESGATISPTEFENAKKQYFPELGDSKEVIEQKRLNRTMAIKGFARGAGSGGKDIEEVFNSTDPLKGGASNSGDNIVTAPDGSMHSFPSAAAAEAFRKAIGQ